MKQILRDRLRPLGSVRFHMERAKYKGSKILDQSSGSAAIRDLILSGTPGAVAKIGATELDVIKYFLKNKRNGEGPTKWGKLGEQAFVNAGVFPLTANGINNFCEEYVSSLGRIDVICTWYRWGEAGVVKKFLGDAKKIPMTALDPFYVAPPWTSALHRKRVLVISPFAESIQRQYEKRRLIWKEREEMLPEMSLLTIKAPLSAALVKPVHRDWMVGLDDLSKKADDSDYDVALVGAGAWSLPLVSRIKESGRLGIHLGGSTQILFGIKGGRWESHNTISGFFNENWCRPSMNETPSSADRVEAACYW